MSLNKLSLGGNNDVLYKIFPPRESLVSDILAGDFFKVYSETVIPTDYPNITQTK
jgi:hypothetical protein